MSAGPAGVAVVGLGVGEAHARAYLADDRCRLLWLLDHDRSRAEALAAELGAGVAETYRQILDDRRVDVVSIASFDADHAAQVLAALRAGKHVFVEKPLCRSPQELGGIAEAWRAAGGRLRLRSNLVLRSAPLYRWLREAVRSGELGEVYALDGEYLYGRLYKITGGWRGKEPDYSVMLGGGVHMVDLMLWLTGQRPQRVFCRGNGICTRDTDFSGVDFAAASFGFDSGLVGRITANFGCVHRHQHVLRVYGSKATFIYDDAGARLHTTRDDDPSPPRVIDLDPLPASKGDLIPAFLDSLWGQAPDPVEERSVLDTIAVCAAADRALAAGREEEISYP